MASGDSELHTLVGAYVMDAVTEFERAAFSRHLTSCPECRAEIRELQEAAARLGTAAAVLPRSELKGQTIRAASRISQLPPATPAPGRTWRRLTALPRAALMAAAVLAASAAVLGVVTQHTMQQLDHSQRQNHMIAAVLNAPDVVILTAKVSTGGTATVMMSHSEHALVFTAHGLRALPAARSYELWLMGPHGDRPAGMLTAEAGGMAGPAVVSGLTPGDMIGLTIEPVAGSRQPTSAPIVLIGHGNN
ncbi:MAG TPA: anti-sigma factor [Streptosporangiaceae bacterium]|nr:anti-sigma factor [Streptosporangiaceae bacterium]